MHVVRAEGVHRAMAVVGFWPMGRRRRQRGRENLHGGAPGAAEGIMTSMRSLACTCTQGESLPGAHSARYFSINYPDFSPRFTL